MTTFSIENNIVTIENKGIKTQDLDLNCYGENEQEGSFTAICIIESGENMAMEIKAVAARQKKLTENPSKVQIVMPKHCDGIEEIKQVHRFNRTNPNEKPKEIIKVKIFAKEIILK